tara:strand:+ start:987 stop:2246 length:1260 start_codon:yes stop_codon:yes gene_type:complete
MDESESKRPRVETPVDAAVRLLAKYPPAPDVAGVSCKINGRALPGVGDAPAIQAFSGDEYGADQPGEFTMSLATYSDRIAAECIDHANALAIVLFLQYELADRWAPLLCHTIHTFTPAQRASLSVYVKYSCARETVVALQACGMTELVIEQLGRASRRRDMYPTPADALQSGVDPDQFSAAMERNRGPGSVMIVDNKVVERPRIVIVDTPQVVATVSSCVPPTLFFECCYADVDAMLDCKPTPGSSGGPGRSVAAALTASLDAHDAKVGAYDSLRQAHATHQMALGTLESAEHALDGVREMLGLCERTRTERAVLKMRGRYRGSRLNDQLCIRSQVRQALELVRSYAAVATVLSDMQAMTDATADRLLRDPTSEAVRTVLSSVRAATQLVDKADRDKLVSLIRTANARVEEEKACLYRL